MAKRLVCCPGVGENKFEYLYVDTAELLVVNVTDKVLSLVDGAEGRCCFDALVGYALGDKVLDKTQENLFPFDFYKLNSFELFKNAEELRLKTGSEIILQGCLLNYYRREYDGTQQHTFFSEPAVSNTYVRVSGGVEHELSLENREFVKNAAEEEFELETLDKGKSDAEREAEAAKAQAELEEQEAIADAQAKAEKKEKQTKARSVRERRLSDEQYREFRNRDDVQAEEYRRFRQHEEEMRNNNAYLTSQYNECNYASLPGYVMPESFAASYETVGTETLGVLVDNHDLYKLASRFEEFDVPYTVQGETLADGRQISHVYYSSDYVDRATSAIDFYTLERNLHFDEVVRGDNYYSAYQLSALEYAYVNNIDAFYVENGAYSGNQMFRILDAGLNGQDMEVLANPAYTPAHMDALSYYMNYGWNPAAISDPSLSLDYVADKLLQEEYKHGLSQDASFFATHDYDLFLGYGSAASTPSFFNEYDSAQQQRYYRQIENTSVEKAKEFEAFKESLHASYEQRQREMNYISDAPEASRVVDTVAGPQRADVDMASASERVVRNGDAPKSERTEAVLRGSGAAAAINRAGDNSFSGQKHDVHGAQVRQHGSNADARAGMGNKSELKVHSFGSGYTPTGFKRDDGSFGQRKMPQGVEFSNARTSKTVAGAGGGGRGPSTSSAPPKAYGGVPGFKRQPLDDLKVRSDFSRKAGLKVQNYGGKCVSAGVGAVRNAFHTVTSKLGQNDETGTVGTYHSSKRVASNVVLTAHLVADLPRQFSRAGQGASRVANSIANVGRRASGNPTVQKTYKTVSSKQARADINALKTQQFNNIKRKYGADAAKMSGREIKANIKGFNKNIAELLENNKALRSDIQKLYAKKRAGGLSKAEAKTLKKKVNTFNNNNTKIRKKQKDIRKLNRLKKQLKVDAKALASAERNWRRFGDKERRWGSLPMLLANSAISQLHKAGADTTMSGIASASGFVMGYVRSPISRIVNKSVNTLIFRPTKFVAKKTGQLTSKYVVKPVVRVVNRRVFKPATKVINRRVIRPATKVVRKSVIKPVTTKVLRPINNKLLKPVKKRINKIAGSKAFNVLKKGWRGGQKATSFVGKIVSVPLKVIGKAANAINVFFAGLKKILLKVALYGALVFLGLLLLVTIVGSISQAASSVFAGKENDDGKIDLNPYIDIINECQTDLQNDINKIINGKSSTGNKYDNVFYDYNGVSGNNTGQILAMTSVRFNGELEGNEDAVEDYMKQLYADSNYFDYTESEPYFCDNGCVEREYHCYDEYDEYATETRKSRKSASDHYGTTGVSSSDEDRYGCQYKWYSCTIKGHGVYNKHGCMKHNDGKVMSSPCSCADCSKHVIETKKVEYYCKGYTIYTQGENLLIIHNDGKAMSSPCSCKNCEKKEEVTVTKEYYCQGYCPGKHKDYFCDGHTEMVCYGKHQDITFSITTLGFDDIFYADSSVAQLGATVRGDAYENKFVVSAYCSCHECCHPYDPACTGKPSKTTSGTTPKANYTLAVDKKNPVVPLGTHVWIDGKEFVVEDTGDLASRGVGFDMYFDSHEQALQWGRRTKTVYKSTVVSEDVSLRQVFDYSRLAIDASTENFTSRYVLQCFGHAKEPKLIWKYDRVNYDTESSFAQKLRKYDTDHEKEEFSNAELNTFEYVTMSLAELQKLCQERGLSVSGSIYTLITERLIPYDKEHPDMYVVSSSDDKLYFDGWNETNKEVAKTIYSGFAADDAEDIYDGLDGITDLSFGIGADVEYDFSGVEFADGSGLTTSQQKIVAKIKANSIATVSGMCQAWVADVYQEALGGTRVSRCCANHAGEAWGVSREWKDIQVGATVYGYSSSKYGHVGIYIGNGMVAHNIGYLKVQSLESWINTYNGQCWGWNGGKNLTGNSKYNCKAAGTFMRGKD